MHFEKFLCLFLFCSSVSRAQNETVREYVDYISNYINFTTTYTLPTNNSEPLETSDNTVYDYGSFDFIIVGGGPAGSVLANRLSEISTWKILLLEVGEAEDRFLQIPSMSYYLRSSPRNWGYFTKPQTNSCQGMVNHSCVFPTGKSLGGSVAIGDMVYGRGNRADFDRWASAGNTGWSYEEVLPYFKKSEDIQIPDYDEGYHGHNGELKVNYTYPDPLNYDALFNANVELGIGIHDSNGERQTGVSKPQWTIDFNKKLSGGTAFIQPIINKRNNLYVSLKSFVTKILFDGTKAIGVEFIKEGKKYISKAKKEVILSAGAINSPQILMLSGIGPKNDLNDLGIEVISDLPVGKYLKDHPVFIPLYVRTNNSAASLTLYEQVERYLRGEAPLTRISEGGPVAYINTKNLSADDPNIEIIFVNPPVTVAGDLRLFFNLDTKHQEMYTNFNTLTDHLMFVINVKPKSIGSVTLKSNSPADYPIVDPAFYSDEGGEDVQVVYEGIQYVLNLTQTAPMRALNATVIGVAPECSSLKDREYWLCSIKYLTSSFFSPTSTTRMGVSPYDSVVNPTFKVHNFQGLRVVDAGSMPDGVSGHLAAVVFMMGEKAADLIKQEYNATCN